MDDTLRVRAQIEHRFKTLLSGVDDVNIPLAHTVLDQLDDRWYGILAVRVYDAASKGDDIDPVIPAATGVELLRAYIRLRSQLLLTHTENHAPSHRFDPDVALLAGDYFHSAAFSSLSTVPDIHAGVCFELIMSASRTITRLFSQTDPTADSADYTYEKLLDELAGLLGKTAAALGATIAGVDDLQRQQFERLGSALGANRELNQVLSPTETDALIVPLSVDETRLCDRAKQRRTDIDQIFEILSKNIDVAGLQAVSELYETTYNQQYFL